jgi:Rieske Fe-S protein
MEKQIDDCGRRRFFSRVIAGVQAAIGGLLGVVLGGAAISPAFATRREDWWEAGSMGSLLPDEPTAVVVSVPRVDGYNQTTERKVLFLVRGGDNTVTALDSTCSHLGCRVSWDKEAGELRCPCHGGAYDKTGAVKAGPPPAPLTTIATRIDGDRVLVQL